MRRWVIRWAVILLPVVSGVALFAVNAARIDWPTSEFWDGREPWIIWSVGLAASLPFVQTLISELGERRRRQELEREQDVRALLVPSLIVVVNDCGLKWDTTGIQAFRVTGWWFRKRQVRMAKIRLASIPSSGVQWTEGKGVIGRCWKTRRPICVDLTGDFATLPTDIVQWYGLERSRTFGLTLEDYRALGTKYGTVAAVPIIDGNDKYIGCVTLDTPTGVQMTEQQRAKALASLMVTADLVSRHLRQ